MGVLGDERNLAIDCLAAGGRGVARLGGQVWLVSGGLPGDSLVARPLKRHRRWVEAEVVRIVEPSPDRRAAPCRFQGACGGCAWMGLYEASQREWKRRIVEDSLIRLGGIAKPVVEPTLPSPRSLGYRNKVEFTFGWEGGRRVLGLHRAGALGELIVDVDRCLLQDAASHRVFETARMFFLHGPGRDDPALPSPTGGNEPLRLVVRRSSADDQVLVALRGLPGPFPSAEAFARRVRDLHPEVAGVVRLVVVPGRRGGVRTIPLAGRAWLHEVLGGTAFELPANSFFQVNPGAAEHLVRLVLEMAGPAQGAHVLELYGGVGVFALALAGRGARAVVCETDREAADAGRRAASAAGLRSVRFVSSDVGTYLASPPRAGPRPDVVVANPPRSGLGRGVPESLTKLGAPRLVLVSCDPATLARDVGALGAGGYALRRVVPVDLFPQTPHVETVSLLEKSAARTVSNTRTGS